MRPARSCASAKPAFMLCMPAGPVRCAASPASHTRPRPKDSASRRSKRTSIDQPTSMAPFSNQGARSRSSSRVRASSRWGKKCSPIIVVSRLLKRSAALTSGALSSRLQRARPPGSGQSAFTEARSITSRISSPAPGAVHSKIAKACDGAGLVEGRAERAPHQRAVAVGADHEPRAEAQGLADQPLGVGHRVAAGFLLEPLYAWP